MCRLSVSNVIYHKFSHGDASYMANGVNVNVMLELTLYRWLQFSQTLISHNIYNIKATVWTYLFFIYISTLAMSKCWHLKVNILGPENIF